MMCVCNNTKICPPKRINRNMSITQSSRRDGASSRNSNKSLGVSSSFTLIVAALACLVVYSENDRLVQLPHVSQARASRSDRHHNPMSQVIDAAHGLFRGASHGQDIAKPHETQKLFTSDQLEAYIRDGYIVVSGLLDSNEMHGLVDAGNHLVSKHIEKSGGKGPSKGNFQVHDHGLILDDKGASGECEENRFRQVALHSKLPTAAAELMQLDEKTQNLRLLR